jgi:hypothetical protein
MSTQSPTGESRHFPEGKRFAFTIFDDTDDARIDNIRPIYELLHKLGLLTTKTVWPVDCPEGSRHFFAGDTLANRTYLAFCQELQRQGFEITWHGATMESSRRERTVSALEAFRGFFGGYPRLHANHALNRENIYWGSRRYQTVVSRFARLLHPARGVAFEGEVEGSPYFWGDLCRSHCKYVRNFAFRELNTLHSDPHMPYRVGTTPYVQHWFSASDAPDAAAFATLVTPDSLDRLCADGGVCIVATHLGKGFVRDGRVDPRVEAALRHVASLPGWFVPTGVILDFLLARGGGRTLSYRELLSLETRHVFDRLRARS